MAHSCAVVVVTLPAVAAPWRGLRALWPVWEERDKPFSSIRSEYGTWYQPGAFPVVLPHDNAMSASPFDKELRQLHILVPLPDLSALEGFSSIFTILVHDIIRQ